MSNDRVVIRTASGHVSESAGQNWWTRLVDLFMNRKVKMQVQVHPCTIDGRATLIHERGLAGANPEGYRYLVAYAAANGYDLKEDRRADFIEGIKRVRDPARANLITLMVLMAAVTSRTATANPYQSGEQPVSPAGGHGTDFHDLKLDIDAIPADDNLLPGLIGWINAHSSFAYDVNDAPGVQKVSATELAHIAFGGTMPKNVDPSSLRIYGLYNFNDRTVYLLDSVDLATEHGKAILLHELVHYLQYQEGVDKSVECRNQLESLAYLLEARYLREQNLSTGISDAHVSRVGQCPTA